MRGIQGQIELLDQMTAFLKKQIEDYEQSMKERKSYMNKLDGQGLDVKFMKGFEQDIETNNRHLKSVIREIEHQQIPRIKRVKRHLMNTRY